jgi:hypothetical protein
MSLSHNPAYEDIIAKFSHCVDVASSRAFFTLQLRIVAGIFHPFHCFFHISSIEKGQSAYFILIFKL